MARTARTGSTWSRQRRLVHYGLALGMAASGAGLLTTPAGSATGDAPITGGVFQDQNANGTRDASESGQGGITVTATDSSGTVSSTVSNTDGTYTLPVAPLGAGPFRIEFSGWSAVHQSGPKGTNNPTSVSFANAGATVDFGVLDPARYCQSNPQLVVSCFVSGAAGGENLETVASFPYSSGATEKSSHDVTQPGPTGFDSPDETKLTSLGETGSVYGQGWHARSKSLYLGAYTKKYVPFASAGSGALYVRHGNDAPTLFYTTGSAANRTVANNNWYQDPWTDQIGKTGWGDIDVVGNRLYAINLEDRSLYVFNIDPTTGNMVGNGPVAVVPVPTAGMEVPGDLRPFGLGNYGGVVYVGAVDSAQSTGGTPWAMVFSFNQLSLTFDAGTVAQFSLSYNRGCAYVSKIPNNIFDPYARCATNDGSAKWRAWGSNPSSADALDATFGVVRTQVNPQPIVSDIGFSDNGDMTLGLRDRFGDQSGRYIPAGNASDYLGNPTLFLTSYTFGDTLRLAKSGNGSYDLESNGTSRSVTGTANSGQGPGGGEFYDADNSLYYVQEVSWLPPFLQGHDETTMGSIYVKPGTSDVVTTAYDVFGRWDTLGVRFMSDTGNDAPNGIDSTDLNVRAYSMYRGTLSGTSPFGKANGLGDLEALCDQAGLELGNFVWYDADKDGVQDPNERPIPGVKVQLRSQAGVVLANAVTNAAGEYYFVSAGAPNLPASPGAEYGIVAAGVQPDTSYVVSFDASSADTSAIGVPASSLNLTITAGGTVTTDSNPTLVSGSAITNVTTGGPGANDHTIDAGYNSTATPTSSTSTSTTSTTVTTVPTSVQAVTTTVVSTTAVPTSVQAATTIATTTSKVLASTGSDDNMLALIGFALIGAGFTLVLITRRRTPRRSTSA